MVQAERGSGDPKVFVLKRELSEVHLLMDNLSAKTNCALSKLDEPAKQAGLRGDWVKQVCDIDWPPEDAKEADQAALLIKVKDFLNIQTSPATGATIAFTLLVTQEDGDPPEKSAATSVFSGIKARLRRQEKQAAVEAAPTAEAEQSDAPSRTSLARTAYPGLIGKARTFRRWMGAISCFLFAWLLLTCLMSWYVAYGNSVLAQLTAAREALAVAEQRVTDAETAELKAEAADSGTAGNNVQAVKPPAQPVQEFCSRTPADPTPNGSKLYRTVPQMQVCTARDQGLARVESVRTSLRVWKEWPRGVLRWPWQWWSKLPPLPPKTATETEVYASAMATLLGTGVLPVFYGILGAGAAIVRLLARKIRVSTLAPRDLNLALQQLALGAVVGACIGLFVGGGKEGLLGPVTLSGTALSFVAGFGVEYVFAALETLLTRIFSVTPGAPSPSPAE